MSGHHEWQAQMIAEHDVRRPFAPENGQALRFRAGDRVVFTNDNGAEFKAIVTGLYSPETPSSLYATGRRYLLDTDCPWMPVTEGSLRHDDEQATGR